MERGSSSCCAKRGATQKDNTRPSSLRTLTASNQDMRQNLQQCGSQGGDGRCVRTVSCGFNFYGETKEAAGFARQSKTRVGTTLPTPMNSRNQARLRCINMRLRCIICAGKASFLRDSDRLNASQCSIRRVGCHRRALIRDMAKTLFSCHQFLVVVLPKEL